MQESADDAVIVCSSTFLAASSSWLLHIIPIILDTSCTDDGFYSRNRSATVLLKYIGITHYSFMMLYCMRYSSIYGFGL